MKLDDRTIRGLPLAEDRSKSDVIYFDDAMAGFGFRVRAGGGRSWVLQYRIGGQQRRVTIGAAGKLGAETARKAAKRHLAQVTLGHDPQEEKRRKQRERTFAQAVADYLAAKQPAWRARTFTEAKRYLTLAAYWKPLDRLSLDTIRREGIAARLRAITKDSGPVAAARAYVALSGFFSWCMGEGFVDANPTIGVNRPPASPPRERVLSDLELAAIWRACRDDHYGWIIKLLVLLGARRAEIGGMRWSEFDLDAGIWTLPSSRSKNKRSLILPLPPLALSIIAAVPRRDNMDHLFGWSPNGFAWWGQAKLEFDARIEPPLKAWRVHDLRRTCATGLGNLGVQPHVIEVALNHASGHRGGIAGVYNKSPYEREVRSALALWADHVRALVDGGARKVLPLRQPASA